MSKPRGRRLKKEKDLVLEEKSQISADFIPLQEENEKSKEPNTFFGLVDSAELDYFKQAESTLNANLFESDDDRSGFVASVLEEAKGKELKLVTNQICSKLMERLVLNSTDEQLKGLFKSFDGRFLSLTHNKYASHVIETLIVRAAALIEKESLNPTSDFIDEEVVSMENLFLFLLNELKPHLNEMITHQYASHSLRLIILVIAGKELPSTTVSNSTLRSKRSKIARKMIEIKDNEDFNRSFQVPASFKIELKELLDTLSSKIDTKIAREYAIHKVASPVLQLLIQVEGLVNKERPFWHLVFLKENEQKDTQEESFVEYLLSDPVGSHFFQNVIRDEKIKYVQRLFQLYISDRVLKLAKRDTTGSFVIQELLRKLKQNEVVQMLNQLIPEMSILMNTNLEIGKTIMEASKTHKDYKKEQIVEGLINKYSPNNQSNILETTLQLESSTLGNTRDDWPTAEERRRALFLEQLIEYDERFLLLTLDNLLELPKERLIQMCHHGVFSHVIESVLKPDVEIIRRRRLLNQFMGSISDLSCNAYGSHIVDKFWDFTIKLNIYKERIARELLENKDKVKESTYGRLVWKNWSMELFIRKKHDWNFKVKEKEYELYPPKKPEISVGPNKRKGENDEQPQKKQKMRGRNRK